MSAERRSGSVCRWQRPLAAALLAGAVSAAVAAGVPAAPAPSVQTMIVGSTGAVLSQSRTVVAGAASIRVGGRACAVAAGTPLATLVADRRAGAPPFAVRDYGRCGSSPASSAQLFVYSIGGQTNRGQDGWEYKVDHRAGTTGAADPSGPLGTGRRLRSGDRVLWFWCHASGGGCQRTLAASPSTSSVTRSGSLTVTVTGYDNDGRAVPVAGAIVTVGSDFASTDSGGRARLIAPSAPGRYAIAAGRHGLVASFPETIVVR